eukprot:TRINITY_DN3127_c1_g1_i1.p1 TRINITY_DN3127_c1_g1~~TRINITY_DN3127_c1_g1_i1.p1  ORF type:complete len:2214 (+),score=648.11 TRINITY_DN3127_c1_g1_i1:411-6644(+)
MSPHVYSIGDQAYRAMTAFGKNQSILVTGESGAGKTETTKVLLQYFAAKGKKADKTDVQSKVLGSTPILEAFGNAKTLRNDNSSRFGKFIIVDFDDTGSIIGARMKTYLLEKSRLIHQAVGERNYHVFYELCAAVSKNPDVLPSASKWKLQPAEEYKFLSGGGDLEMGYDEAENFENTRKAMQVVGITEVEIDDMCCILAGILSLGNISFYNNDKDAAIVEDDAQKYLDLTTELFGCDKNMLLQAITTKNITTGKDSYQIPLNKIQAEIARDSLAMLLYETLFLWLVDRINKSMQSTQDATSFIGILDIYGFESFKINSFEQFCINYANEKLQQQFNQHMFKLEQEEYEKEGIDWKYVKFADNQPCIHLIEKNLGIVSILNEESKFPRATPQTFVTKLVQKNGRNPYFEKAPYHDHGFVLRHYPGNVEYDATYFLDKNKNAAQTEYVTIFKSSKNAFLKKIFLEAEAQNAKKADKAETVASQFKDSLQQLMDTIQGTEPNYIRCIKPNPIKKPGVINQRQVIEQLRCNGVLEAIRIARDGFPTRLAYSAFFNRFRLLGDISVRPDQCKSEEDFKEATKQLMSKLTHLKAMEMYQFGHTKFFLKGGQLAALEDMRTSLRNKSVIVLQKYIRGHRQHAVFMRRWNAVISLQNNWRMLIAMQVAFGYRKEKAIDSFQRYIRRWNVQIIFSSQLASETSTYTIQRLIRGWNARVEYDELRNKIVVLQALWRARKARRQYQIKLEEAKQVGSLLSENQSLTEKLKLMEIELAARAEATEREDTEKAELLKSKLSSLEHELQKKNNEITSAIQSSNQLSSEVASWRDKYKELNKEFESLKRKGDEKEKIIGELKVKSSSLETKNKELQTLVLTGRETAVQLEAKETELKLLKQQFEAKSKELSSFKESDRLLREELDNLKRDKAEEEERSKGLISKLKNQLEEESKRSEKLENDLDNMKSEVSDANRKLNNTTTTLEEEKNFLDKRIKQYQEESTKSTQQINDLHSEKLRLITENEVLVQNVDRLKQEIDREKKLSEEKINRIQNRLNEVNEESNEQLKLKQKIKEIKNDLTSKLEEEQKKHFEEVQKLTSELSEKSSSLELLQLENQQIINSRDSLKRSMDELNLSSAREKIRFESTIQQLKDDLTSREQEIESRKTSQNELEETVRKLRQKISSGDFDNDNDGQISDVSSEKMKQVEADLNMKIQRLEIDNQQLSVKNKSLNQQIFTLNSDFALEKQQVEQSLQNVKIEITEKAEMITRLEKKIEQLNNLDKLRNQEVLQLKESLQSEKQRSSDILKRVQGDVDETSEQITKLTVENQRLNRIHNEELERMKEEYEMTTMSLTKQFNQAKSDLSNANRLVEEYKVKSLQSETNLQQKYDDLQFEVEHNKLTNDKKIQQLENTLRDREQDISFARQENRKLGVAKRTAEQLLEEFKSAVDHEKKSTKKWEEKCRLLKEELEEASKKIQELNEALSSSSPSKHSEGDNVTPVTSPSRDWPPKSNRKISRSATVREDSSSKDDPEKKSSSSSSSKSKKSSGLTSSSSSSSLFSSSTSSSSKKKPKKKTTESNSISEEPDNLIVTSTIGDSEQPEVKVDDSTSDVSTDNEHNGTSSSSISSPSTVDNSIAGKLKKMVTRGRSVSSAVSPRKDQEVPGSPSTTTSPGSTTKTKKPSAAAGLFKRFSRVGLTKEEEEKVGFPEKQIMKVLAHINPPEQQFKKFLEIVLHQKFIEFLFNNDDDVKASVSGLPLPAFVIVRIVDYIRNLPTTTSSNPLDVNLISTVITSNIKECDKIEILIPFLNITGALMHILPQATENPAATKSITLSVDWVGLSKNEPIPVPAKRTTVAELLQHLYGVLYGKILFRLINSMRRSLQQLYSEKTAGEAIYNLVNCLMEYLQFFQTSCIRPEVISNFYNDVFQFADAIIFNDMILRKDLCTIPICVQLKMNIEEIVHGFENSGGTQWITTKDRLFKHTKQLISVVTLTKSLLTQKDIRKQVCPDLNITQLKQICSIFEGDDCEQLEKVIEELSLDEDNNTGEPTLITIGKVKVPTEELHVIHHSDLQLMAFPQDVVDVVVKRMKHDLK